ncbi:exodeoxyribonuclease VII large subunit [Actimicrobium sp. CCI2.3]|uniref:exodeoxyribonuclease VII large subunit n=1 Tax=Actimicrobium sp. CCI2.3 TaxID=3048616 RepID=UPI002AB374C6|nr:exodeoxyribonuclease VII large subunit [Actimicrobium sp. CCI2.3]MDY7575909.1 exodeoxyribonuclease VII large subunit [Actimicrobium sp. CCI2.3]MEB0023177.1 exodeoxyribonuclease VII large subunit [Actimicrobium sp. CCI2.3]
MSTDHLFDKADSSSPVLTVSALNQAVARMLEQNFPLMWVAGEVSNFTRAASGHWYFSLKDASAQVRAVMFRGRAQYAGFLPKEGDKVEVRTLVTLYAARGDFQLSVESIRRAGVGNLFEAFLQLKQKLESEGLFDPARKRPLPQFPRTIGIVTSLQAAALRDVLTTLKRRTPHIKVILYPTPVQGDGAAQKIAQAITTASRRAECDLLLLCRGGGSIEDLWSFNDETVARAIVACRVPVIAGIGHETDFTIADFAADLRAATPTAAAELAARPRQEWIAHIELTARTLTRVARRHLTDRNQGLDWLSRRLVSPAATIRHEQVRLAGWQVRLGNATRTPLNNARHALHHLRSQLAFQLPDTRPARWQLTEHRRRLAGGIDTHTSRLRLHLSGLETQLELLNPQRTLERGYAIIIDAEGHIVRTTAQLHPEQTVTVRLAEGNAQIGIASVQPTLQE